MTKLSIGAVFAGPLPTKPEEVNLCFVRCGQFSDAPDGKSVPMNGSLFMTVNYGPHPVWHRRAQFTGGMRESSDPEGSAFFRQMADVALVYQRIRDIVAEGYILLSSSERKAYFPGMVPKEGWDRVSISPQQLEILQAHPQYVELAMLRRLTLELVGHHEYRVVVSKFQTKSVA